MSAGEKTMPPLTVRAAANDDHDALAEIFTAARRQAFHWRPPDSFSPQDFAAETAGERIFVAESATGEVIGFISVWEPERFIHHLFVAPAHQRRGVGRQLIEHLLSHVPLPYQLKCASRNEPALQFYERHGWREVGTGIGVDGRYLRLEWRGPDSPLPLGEAE